MERTSMKRGYRAAAWLIVLGLLVGLGSAVCLAGPCEQALLKCINDPVWMNMFGSFFCLNGYLFCLKYIE